MYYFADWVQTPDGKRAAFPEGMEYAEMAQHQRAYFALFECQRLEKKQITEKIVPVSDELEDLLEAAKQYAPALALSRHDLARQKPTTRDAFQQVMVERLRHHLQRQPTAPYFMAQVLVTQTGYKYAGTFYWIVGYLPARTGEEIAWVSRDFFVYNDPLAHFDAGKAMLEERFIKSHSDGAQSWIVDNFTSNNPLLCHIKASLSLVCCCLPNAFGLLRTIRLMQIT